MISANVFNIASVNADALYEVTKMGVIPSGRSVLSSLMSVSCVGGYAPEGTVSYADVLAAATQDSVDGPSEHTAMIGAYIDAQIPIVSQQIAFIQNQVTPKVYEFEAKMDATLARLEAMSPMTEFNIIQVSDVAVLRESEFLDMVQRYADPDVNIPNAPTNLPAMSTEELLRIMSVSSGALDQSLKAYLATKGDAWLQDIWHYYFARQNTSPSGSVAGNALRDGMVGIQRLPSYDRQAVGLAVFLLSRGLLDEPLEAAGMSLSNWRTLMDEMSRWSAHQAVSATRQLTSVNQNETIVISTADNGKTIVVNSDAYAKYLEQGGELTDIIGAVLHNRNMNYSIQGMQENGVKYKQVWDNYCAVSRSYMDSKAATLLRSEAMSAFAQLCKCCNEDEQEYMTECGVSFEGMQQQAHEVVEAMSLKQLRHTRDLALCLVAGIRFAHTPAKQFLTDMLEAQEAGCENPAEAAAVAALGYIADYMSCDLALTRA